MDHKLTREEKKEIDERIQRIDDYNRRILELINGIPGFKNRETSSNKSPDNRLTGTSSINEREEVLERIARIEENDQKILDLINGIKK